MNDELMVTLESVAKIQDFNELSTELASALRNFKEFEKVNVGDIWVSGVSLNNVINIFEVGTILLSYYDIDFTNEDLLSFIFTRLDEIRGVVAGIVNTEFNDMTIRLNFECPNTISEITEKLHSLERVLAKAEIGINSISMKHAERIGGPYKALEVIVSY